MSKNILFVAIISADQDASTGAIVTDHINRKVGSIIHMSDRFDMSKESELRTAINDQRSKIFGGHLSELNKDLPQGMDEYKLGKPRMVGDLYRMKGMICTPIEFSLEVDGAAEIDPTTKFNPLLLTAKVTEVKVLPTRLCTHPQPYGIWPKVEYGAKFDKSSSRRKESAPFNGMGDQLAKVVGE